MLRPFGPRPHTSPCSAAAVATIFPLSPSSQALKDILFPESATRACHHACMPAISSVYYLKNQGQIKQNFFAWNVPSKFSVFRVVTCDFGWERSLKLCMERRHCLIVFFLSFQILNKSLVYVSIAVFLCSTNLLTFLLTSIVDLSLVYTVFVLVQ